MIRLPPALEAVIMAFTASVFFAVMAALIREAGDHANALVVVFFRNFFQLVIMAPWAIGHGLSMLRTERVRLYGWRSGLGVLSMLTYFSGVMLIPIGQATALGFAGTLFATAGAAVFLGETVRARRWTAVAIGFLGVLVITRPWEQAPSFGAVLVLISAALGAASALTVKTLSRTEPTPAMVTYMALFMTPMSLLPALVVWEWPSWVGLGWMFLVAAVGTCGHLCYTRAIHLADASAVFPFDYVKLPLTALLGWWFFAEVLSAWTWVGAGIIVVSSLYIAHRETVVARREAREGARILHDAARGKGLEP